MDRNALRAVQDNPGIPAIIKDLDKVAVALLIDTSAPDRETLEGQTAGIRKSLKLANTLSVGYLETSAYNSI
jgi:D-lactate dehydrogenase